MRTYTKQTEAQVLREALKFYADVDKYSGLGATPYFPDTPPILLDRGDKAREALNVKS